MTANVASSGRALSRVLAGERVFPPPVWLMRQAGRYLPEYRATRAEAGSFLTLCYTPRLATEVTLQPIRRYGFDAAILFSDILVVPDGLGQPVRFVEGEGPRLDPLDLAAVGRLDLGRLTDRLAPVYEAVALIRASLPAATALIGFCGAPWTVATYMVAGGASADQAPARRAALADPAGFRALVEVLVEASVAHLVAQLRAGAEAVQIFDTWAGVLDGDGLEDWVIGPTRAIVEGVRAAVPGAKIIGFPKGIGAAAAVYTGMTGVDAIGIDWTMELGFARDVLQTQAAVQGNLDPMRLVVGGAALDAAVDRIVAAFSGGPHIFNLGHGITPDVPPENVARLVERLRAVPDPVQP